MSRLSIRELAEHVGKSVTTKAWVQTIRDQGKISFLILRDVTGTCQAVAFTPKDNPDTADLRSTLDKLTMESVVQVSGEVVAQQQAPGGFEIGIKELEIISLAEPELPIPVIEKSGEVDQALRMDYRWLDLRKPENLLIFQVWTTFEHAFRSYYIDNNFIEIHSPKLMSAASESGAEVFEVKYFDRKAFLAQSPQFYKQMGMSAGFERVFEVGAVYRAEHSFTTRHATEFTGYDFEMSFIDSHEDVMQMLENSIAATFQAVKDKHGKAIKELLGQEVIVPKTPFPRMTLADIKKALGAKGIKSEKDGDLSPEEERALSEMVFEEHGHEFCFVTEYPPQNRAFYHMRKEDDNSLTKGFDLMFRGVEITTGAQREHRYDILVKQALEKGLTEEGLKHYLDFFRYGCPPHGGAGIGPGRIIMRMLDVESLREVTYLYRGVNRLTP